MSDAGMLSPTQLERLRRFSTPSLSNAIEVFDVRPRTAGFMRPEIRCQQSMQWPMVGYAMTGRFRAAAKPKPGEAAQRKAYWEWLQRIPQPRVVVLQDLDDPPAQGSFWGEVQATTHQALECVGTVTNGGVRDLREAGALGFHFFAAHAIVSHAYVHLLDFGTPVEVGGLTVAPGDLLHGDEHGVLLIPASVAPFLADVAEQYEAVEQRFIHTVRAGHLDAEGLAAEWERLVAERGALSPPAGFRP
jgi:4-hydroxy-4-methyl-2-oxoglutarate aldolase